MKPRREAITIAYADLTDANPHFGQVRGTLVRGKPVPDLMPTGYSFTPNHFDAAPLNVEQTGKVFTSWGSLEHEGTCQVFLRQAVAAHARKRLLYAMTAAMQDFDGHSHPPSMRFASASHPQKPDTEKRTDDVYVAAHVTLYGHHMTTVFGKAGKDADGRRWIRYPNGYVHGYDLSAAKRGVIFEVPNQEWGVAMWGYAKDVVAMQNKLRDLQQAQLRKKLNDALTLRDRLIRLNVSVPFFQEYR